MILLKTFKTIPDTLFPFPPLEGTECKLCPRDWLLHRRKCYWVSKAFKNWKKSFEDCTVKTSQMLVIQDQDEMVKKI